ncbi:MAG: nucleoside kinase, partial [Spirochaetes bacterium]|nr:nucleoside kinase [Spirochaetota bacterium]
EMKKEVKKNKEINREKISYIDALDHFKKNGRKDKYKLLSGLNMSKLSIYRCDDFFQVVDLPLVNRTGVLNKFELIYYAPGFILQFPKKTAPDEIAPFIEQRRIFEVYKEYKEWGKILKVDNVGSLNKIVSDNQINNFIQVVEALHTKKIIHIADEIYKRRKEVRLVCIAGPSSSGKTTFSKRLSIQLQTLGLRPVTISVDNYFIDREKTPLDEKGKPNYESIDAINIELFNEHLRCLLRNEQIKLPFYNFFTGKSTISNKTVSIGKNEIIVIEGIHCLNEKLTYIVPKPKKYKIYISVLTQMNIDDNNRIRTTDNRLIRRIVRDYKFRGHSAIKTLRMWPSVRRGEEKYIFPFQNDADGYFSSALDYELALLRSYAEPLLTQIKPYDEEYAKAVRLLKFLSYFIMIQSKYVPTTSLIREFIGGSFFRY